MSIETLFKDELPNLFPKLSYTGVVTSVSVARSKAKAELNPLILEGDFVALLEAYQAGPWAFDAPEWLREQYGVGLPKKDALNGSGQGATSAVVVPGLVVPGVDVLAAGVPPVSVLSPADRAARFYETWGQMKLISPELEHLTLEELELGLSDGIEAVIALKKQSRSGGMAAGGPVGVVSGGSSFAAEMKALTLELSEMEALLGEPMVLTVAEKIQAVSMGLGPFLMVRVSGTLGSGLVPLSPAAPLVASVIAAPVAPAVSAPVAVLVVAPVDPVEKVPAESGQELSEEKSSIAPGTEKQKTSVGEGDSVAGDFPAVVDSGVVGSTEPEISGLVGDDPAVVEEPVEELAPVAVPVVVAPVVVVEQPVRIEIPRHPRKVSFLDPNTGKEASWVIVPIDASYWTELRRILPSL